MFLFNKFIINHFPKKIYNFGKISFANGYLRLF